MPDSTVRKDDTLIHSGCPVFTSDGKQLGDVAEVRGESFKVAGEGQADFWLDCGCVRASSDERITLKFDSNVLESHRRAAPGAMGDTSAADESDNPLDEAERLDGHHAAAIGLRA